MSQLSEEEKSEARRIFAAEGADSRVCQFCGGFHHRACPRVSEFELYEGGPTTPGRIKRVVFWPEGTWDDSYIVWPEDLADEEAEDGMGEG